MLLQWIKNGLIPSITKKLLQKWYCCVKCTKHHEVPDFTLLARFSYICCRYKTWQDCFTLVIAKHHCTFNGSTLLALQPNPRINNMLNLGNFLFGCGWSFFHLQECHFTLNKYLSCSMHGAIISSKPIKHSSNTCPKLRVCLCPGDVLSVKYGMCTCLHLKDSTAFDLSPVCALHFENWSRFKSNQSSLIWFFYDNSK